MKVNKLNLAIFMAVYGLSQNVYADNVTQLNAITVTASPVNEHEILDVPSQINTLSGAEKNAKQSGSLGETLEYIPGVNNMSTGTQSGKPVIRGMTGNRIKLLSNGQNSDYQQLGIRHLPNVDAFLSDRIEVVRGPQSVLYGSQAIGGVVNILDPEFIFDGKTRGEIATELNTSNRETMVGAKVSSGSDKFAIYGGASIRNGDNLRVPEVTSSEGTTHGGAKSTEPLFVGEVPYTNFENRAANLGVAYQGGWGQMSFRYNDWSADQNYVGIKATGGANPYTTVPTGQKLSNKTAQLEAEIFAGGDWVIKPSLQTLRNVREAEPGAAYETMTRGSANYLDILIKRDDIKLAVEHPTVAGFEGEFGFTTTNKDQDLRDGKLTPTADETKRAIYLFEEMEKGPWLVQFGLRHDWHDVKAPLDGLNNQFVTLGIFDATNNSQDWSVSSGSLGANYKFDKHWSLAANMATGFRAPSIFELYAGGVHGGVSAYQIGNPNLKAETSLNTDLSLRWQTKTTQMTATVYNNFVNNYIYLANTGLYRDNAGNQYGTFAAGRMDEMKAEQTDARIFGAEFSLSHRFDSNWSADFGLEVLRGEDTKQNRQLPLMPANNARVDVYYEPDNGLMDKDKWQLGVKMVAEKNSAGQYEPFSQFDDKMKVGTASTNAYAVFDLGYQSQFKMNKQVVELDAKVENLFDTAYVDFLNTYKGYTLNPARNLKVGLRMKF